jgi:hypothetical protein
VNFQAVVVIGRKNIEQPGTSPFSPIASGICVHPDGVVATCWHVVSDFLHRWSPYEPPTGPNSKLVIDDAEPQERPVCFFPDPARSSPNGQLVATVYPMLTVQGDREQDIAVIELGSGLPRSLPFVSIAGERPTPGEPVELAGFRHSDETQYDPEGNIIGWRMIHEKATILACVPEGLLVDYPVAHGMSGGGVWNSRGALVGIIKERWHPEHTQRRIGLKKAVGLAAYGDWIVPQYRRLRNQAEQRAYAGEIPWCGGIQGQ